MGYIKAGDVLPRDLLRAVQRYIDGAYLYIPRGEQTRRAWGETTRAREILGKRNAAIFKEYSEGQPVAEVAKRYFLSEKTVYKIIRLMRNG